MCVFACRDFFITRIDYGKLYFEENNKDCNLYYPTKHVHYMRHIDEKNNRHGILDILNGKP